MKILLGKAKTAVEGMRRSKRYRSMYSVAVERERDEQRRKKGKGKGGVGADDSSVDLSKVD